MANRAEVTPTHASAAGNHLMLDHAEQVGHGNSPAAWTAVLVMLLGALVACVGFAMASTLIFWIGIAIIAVGLIIGIAMRMVGYGVGGSKIKTSGH